MGGSSYLFVGTRGKRKPLWRVPLRKTPMYTSSIRLHNHWNHYARCFLGSGFLVVFRYIRTRMDLCDYDPTLPLDHPYNVAAKSSDRAACVTGSVNKTGSLWFRYPFFPFLLTAIGLDL